ncbi:exodeoxyribonuclease III [Paucilactobacillus hokkaidonensis JCM 18461]|uniref:Exodeoxyribonuclease III n=2 Tax=Paucilactobacillus hokkaidonensis TaxID=1193095 RepID=A0A0A1GW17_9LACO|nr:exodeoxyribonuclease III [Paucilactobacillus hokkaidonensis]KRO08235.1 xth protein [Paucilactobacillus hokkaidonensis]BAP86160.1 exodeoxyribonuclease III [Paucilactobacillus hokkaidonensis JCM 18461]
MKLISWNVNGLRAAVKHDFVSTFNNLNADFFCIQETKLQAGQIKLDLPGYHQFWNYAQKKGYSGTAIFAKQEPLNVTYGMDIEDYDTEGRIITLEYANFYLVTCYTPNSGQQLKRLDFRGLWDDAFKGYLNSLAANKSVLVCGDLNVAHETIDIKNPQSNHHSAGFTDQERQQFTKLLTSGFTDTFRHFYPEETGRYSWWSYRFSARDRNAGWRIDYFLSSNDLIDQLQDAQIHSEIFGSDHCPVELDVDL